VDSGCHSVWIKW